MPDLCPTPAKARYATREAAITAALRQRLARDKLLHPYQCEPTCSWWHLTSSAPVALTPDDVAAVANLDPTEFRQLVIHEAQGRAPRVHALALRDRSLLHHWILEIKAVQRELQRQMERRARFQDERSQQWRAETTTLQGALGARRQEAAALIARPGPVSPEVSQRRSQGELREQAGDIAIKRLTDAHRAEFTRYLVEEFARVGAEVPKRIRRYQEEFGIPDPQQHTDETGTNVESAETGAIWKD